MTINGIVDLHHSDNFNGFDEAITAGGMVALVHKATQGKDWHDPKFANRIAVARAHGLLVGAYHFGSNSSDGAQQADLFLKATGAPADMLHALDWESNPDTHDGDMSVENACRFVERVHAVTGRWPVFYSFTSYLHVHLAKAEPRLARCRLWQAQYGERPGGAASKTWAAIDLWQYTNGGDGPHDQAAYPRKMPGLGGCDRSAYSGDLAALKAWWSSAGRA